MATNSQWDHHLRIQAWAIIMHILAGHHQPTHLTRNGHRDTSKDLVHLEHTTEVELDIHSSIITSSPTTRTCSTEWEQEEEEDLDQVEWAVAMAVVDRTEGIITA